VNELNATTPLYYCTNSVQISAVLHRNGQGGVLIAKMEAMVKRGTVKSVVAGWTVVVPTSEVERLRSPNA
jgi:hypothetical protein